MNDTGNPRIEDREFFTTIAENMRTNVEKYRDAGKWLNNYCTEQAYWQREKEKLARKGPSETYWEARQTEQLKQEIKNKKTPSLHARLGDARHFLKQKYKDHIVISEADAKRIILVTWLLTDPNAQNVRPHVTRLQEWAWEPCGDITKKSRCVASALWFESGEGYEDWVRLARSAWEGVAAEVTAATSGRTSPIFGETWNLGGISINCRNLIDKLKHLKGWKRVVAWLGIALILISVVGFYTRSHWMPILYRSRADHTKGTDSSIKTDRILGSLREICEDIDGRPVLQKDETAKRYVSMRISREPLTLYDIHEETSGTLVLIMVFADKGETTSLAGWGIYCTVKKNEYPALSGAKQGLTLYVSGIIEEARRFYVRLSDVSLAFD